MILPALLPLILQQQDGEGGFFFPPVASDLAIASDSLFFTILYLSGLFFAIIVFTTLYFVWKYHHTKCPEPQPSPVHNNTIEVIWTVVPTILLAWIFMEGFEGFMARKTPPPDAYEIHAQGRKWSWNFTYPDGTESSVLHLPLGKAVRVNLASSDVLHSLFVPAFRVKMDVVPGRYEQLWFTPTMLGEFDVYCAEYCGTNHSAMITTAVVHSQEDFDAWLSEAGDFMTKLSPIEAGERVFASKGCAACHSVAGVAGIGPALNGRFGQERKLSDGSSVTFDATYVRESLLDPTAKIADGFQPIMPTFQGQLDDDKMRVLVEYIKSLQ